MKQFQTVFENEDTFRATIAEWKAWQTEHSCRQTLFHIFSDGARVCFYMHNDCDYARRIRMQARWTKVRKREASLSKRVATLRNSLSLRKKVSTR